MKPRRGRGSGGGKPSLFPATFLRGQVKEGGSLEDLLLQLQVKRESSDGLQEDDGTWLATSSLVLPTFELHVCFSVQYLSCLGFRFFLSGLARPVVLLETARSYFLLPHFSLDSRN